MNNYYINFLQKKINTVIQALSFNLNTQAHINIIVHPHELIKYVHGGSRHLTSPNIYDFNVWNDRQAERAT